MIAFEFYEPAFKRSPFD